MHCTEPDSGSVPTLNNKSHNLSVDDEVDRQANLLLHEASSPVRHVVSPLTAAYPDLRLKLPAVVYHSSRDLNSVQLYPSLNRINTALCNFHHSTGNLTHLVPIDFGLITRGGEYRCYECRACLDTASDPSDFPGAKVRPPTAYLKRN